MTAGLPTRPVAHHAILWARSTARLHLAQSTARCSCSNGGCDYCTSADLNTTRAARLGANAVVRPLAGYAINRAWSEVAHARSYQIRASLPAIRRCHNCCAHASLSAAHAILRAIRPRTPCRHLASLLAPLGLALSELFCGQAFCSAQSGVACHVPDTPLRTTIATLATSAPPTPLAHFAIDGAFLLVAELFLSEVGIGLGARCAAERRRGQELALP